MNPLFDVVGNWQRHFFIDFRDYSFGVLKRCSLGRSSIISLYPYARRFVYVFFASFRGRMGREG